MTTTVPVVMATPMLQSRLEEHLAALNAMRPEYCYFEVVQPVGRKYAKVAMRYQMANLHGVAGNSGSVHLFVNRMTGDVFKPAGWNAPADGVRYRMADPVSWRALQAAGAVSDEWSGGYLYATGAAKYHAAVLGDPVLQVSFLGVAADAAIDAR
jgi:hypothetical protein